ncbi:MAG: hypothetical protein GY913_11880 [Proteobacteria bacterium]|nr:hypothetical protein [Pseudomonadota bacterium]MCP4917614.1 hypothetical protein [Pseudomonadota bacterium]
MWTLIPTLFLGVAHADAISMDSSLDCPNGSRITVSHAGSWCEPTDCSTSETCGDGSCTQDLGLCITTEEVGCGGMQRDSGEPCTFTKEEAHDTCKTDSDCTQGTCQVRDRCGSDIKKWCGCSAVTPVSAGLGALLLGLALVGRRRQSMK